MLEQGNTGLYRTASARVGAHTAGCNAVVAAERAFARMAGLTSIREAFLANMNDSSVVQVNDHFEEGISVYSNQPVDTLHTLVWQPAFAAISAAGDLGYTTGPYQYNGQGKALAFGNYSTVWQRQPGGQWKFIVDLGNRIDTGADRRLAKAVSCLPPAKADLQHNDTNLLALDRTLAASILSGSVAGYQSFVHPQVHIIRPGKVAIETGNERQLFYKQGIAVIFEPGRQVMARSKDLGLVYGTCRSLAGAPKKGVYFHLWRRDADRGWQLLHETVSW